MTKCSLTPLLLPLLLLLGSCDLVESLQPVSVESVSLSSTSLELFEGETATLTAQIQPSDAKASITWTSSNTAVATVSDGKVTAVSEGTATISASADGKSAYCQVTVLSPVIEATSITVDPKEMTLYEGETTRLNAYLHPSNATDQTITWSTSNPAVVTVNEGGHIRAIAVGTATVAASHGNLSDNCKITVLIKTVPVSSITLNKTSLILFEQETFQLTATVKPDNATDKTVIWSSSDPAVATISDGGFVTGVKEGYATITAKAGDKTATCSIAVTTKTIWVNSVSLDKTTLTLTEQETFQLTATVKPDNATNKTVTWSSSSTAVATVSDNGLVTAVKEGSATITARAEDEIATCVVTVTKSAIAVSSISLNKTSLSLTEQDTYQLTATVKPDDATDKTVSWSSSNPAVATVSSTGLVTAVKEGSATITAKAGEKSATCAVSVAKKVIAVSSVTLNKTSLSLTEQDTFQLSATISPNNATDKTVTWSSSNTAVATVSSNGLVTAVKEGSATITAKAGDKTATCAVTVAKKVIDVTSVTLNKTSISLTEQDTFQLTATVKPDNATDKTVIWTSSNYSIVTVDQNGLVTAVAAGSATITALAGDKKATCTVTVNKKPNPATSITLDYSSLQLARGSTFTLKATVLPEDADNKTVSWSSSSTAVATVDKYGKVTAVKAGNATITATCSGLSAICDVTVVVPVTSITLNITSKTLRQNESVKLTATVKPTDATDKTVTWTSDNPSVAKVDGDGNVTAVKEGTATITAKAGELIATCAITVSNNASGGHEGTGTEVWY